MIFWLEKNGILSSLSSHFPISLSLSSFFFYSSQEKKRNKRTSYPYFLTYANAYIYISMMSSSEVSLDKRRIEEAKHIVEITSLRNLIYFNFNIEKKKPYKNINYILEKKRSSHAIILLLIIFVIDSPEAITGCILFIVAH